MTLSYCYWLAAQLLFWLLPLVLAGFLLLFAFGLLPELVAP
jgi:hypothetical protein